jgi:ketosteroid isomerase-like protein
MRPALILFLLFACIPAVAAAEDRAASLRAAETEFARSFAERDLEKFSSFVAEDAVFFSSRGVLRGRSEVVEGWRALLTAKEPPFSWAPEEVEVNASGDLGFSSGPIVSPAGKRVATFYSVWRRDAEGEWRVVFDKGGPWCEPQK